MTASSTPSRPRQATLSGWLIMLGSVFVVLTVFERVAGLQSLETQQSVERFLAEPPGDGLGLGVQGVLGILRALALVAGACAAAAAVLGYFVLQRSHGARLALSVLALPLFVAGMATGGFMSSVVVASIVMLWFQPARDWFNGVTPAQARHTPERPSPGADAPRERVGASLGNGSPATGSSTPDPAGDQPSGGSTAIGSPSAGSPGGSSGTVGAAPPAYPGFGAPPASGQAPAAWPTPAPGGGPGAPDARPGGVLTACVLAWVMSSLAALMMAISVAVLASSPGRVYDELVSQNPELAEQGISKDVLIQATFILGTVVIVWSLMAIALAVLVFRRVAWARPALMASAGVAALLSLVALAVGQVVTVLPLAACLTTIVALARADVRAWFRR